MHNIWNLFVGDLKRLKTNVCAIVIALGLVLLPSLFSWYNVLACWDVFDNTDNLKVAVANTDEGYQSDLVPLKARLGEEVVSSLRENNQMNWVFTTEEDAIDGARSGKYYAAVVIPPSFSKDMMTFYSSDVEHTQLIYYSNEKKNVVAPKLTDQGADKVANQVNKAFMETLSEVALSVASSISKYTDTSDANSRVGELASHINTMSDQMRQASKTLATYSTLLDASQSLIEGSSGLLASAKTSASSVAESASESKDAVSSISSALLASSEELGVAINKSAQGYEGVDQAIDEAFASANTLSSDTADRLDDQAASIDAEVEATKDLVTSLEALKETVPDDQKAAIETLIVRLNASIELQSQLSDGMKQAAADIRASNATTQEDYEAVKQQSQAAKESLQQLSQDYNTEIKPQLDTLTSEVSSMSESLLVSARKLSGIGDSMSGTADSMVSRMQATKKQLSATAADLNTTADKLSELSTSLIEALNSGDRETVRQVLNSDPESLASALSAPVQLDRQAVFPADNFGSQMAPLYTTIGVWIGSLLMLVAIKTTVSRRARDELNKPKMHQLFLGRFGIFALLSFLQTTVLALGNMLFLGVQTNEPFLYLLCFWLAGLVFTFIIYTLVVSFANLGKAIAVFLLIIQITSGGGSFPLPILPDFFQWLSPFLPATHVINAMRAAMMGVYEADFWIEIGCLLLFLIPFALLGLALRKPLMKFLHWYIDRVEESKLVV